MASTTLTLTSTKSILIQGAAPAGVCGHCPTGNGNGDTDCHSTPAWPLGAAQLNGPSDELAIPASGPAARAWCGR